MTHSVTRTGRHQLQYVEDGRTLTVEVESGFDRPIEGPIGPQHLPFVNLAVYVRRIRQWDNGDPISEEERTRITQNISEALTASGTKHVLE